MKRGMVAWFFVGAGAGVALLSAASIGLFLAPLVLAAAFLLARATPGATATFAAVGAGAVLVSLGLANLDYRPCSDRAVVTADGETYSCGGPHPAVMIGLGVLVATGGVVSYASMRRRETAQTIAESR